MKSNFQGGMIMVKFALYVPLEARPGKEEEVAAFLRAGLPLVNEEPGTVAWFGVRFGRTSFAIFDAFPDEDARDAHLSGKVAAALMARADELFAAPPQINKLDVVAAKLP
jgi:quinol monooxygenase YgiN